MLMDYPIHTDTISIELSISDFKGLPVKILLFGVPEDCFLILANNVDPDEMLTVKVPVLWYPE